MKLLVISHTEHYKNSAGEVVGWGPTVREINFLASHFEKIYHCAPLHLDTPPLSSLPYEKDNISFVPLMPAGGSTLIEKLNVLFYAPGNISIIRKTLKKIDVFQFRAPTGMGVYLIPYLNFFVKKPGWFKYAGNWIMENPPFSYAFQRYLLKKQKKRKVTINGKWPDQPDHCITFENPCLDEKELEVGWDVINKKDYKGKLDFCFVGRLEAAKGVKRILDAFQMIGKHDRIGTIHFVGDGKDRSYYENICEKIPLDFVFHGYLNRNKVAEIMKQCHVFLLPSDSEGFPKVLAEAANYGCLPVVSDVSSIGQYISDSKNGFLIDVNDRVEFEIKSKILNIFELKDVKEMVRNFYRISKLFTFEHYTDRIFNEILNK